MPEDESKGEQEAATALKPYGFADATGLFSQQTSIMNGLWAIYVAATFAIAGFGISTGKIRWDMALVVTIGFWVFALGHLSLLRQTLRILEVVRSDLKGTLSSNPSMIFNRTLRKIVDTSNPQKNSTAAHLIIDVCATSALWFRVFS